MPYGISREEYASRVADAMEKSLHDDDDWEWNCGDGFPSPPSYQPSTNITDPGEYEEIGAELGSLVDRKEEQYGSSYYMVPDILRLLYPDGIGSHNFGDLLAITRVLDKLCRISRGNQGEENAWKDIAGYAILMSKE